MSNPVVLFDENWNKKLDCDVFTTIRKANPYNVKFYQDNHKNVFDVVLQGLVYKTARLQCIRRIPYQDIQKEVICCDVGFVQNLKIKQIFNAFNIDTGVDVLVLTFETVHGKV